MSVFAVSVHVDRADAAFSQARRSAWVRVPLSTAWDTTLQEITRLTAAPYPEVIVGLHTSRASGYFHYNAVAHRRDAKGQPIQPAKPQDRLYGPDGITALPDFVTRQVAAEVSLLPSNSRRADDHLFFPVDKSGFRSVQTMIADWTQKPPLYHTQNTCATFAREVLRTAGIVIPMPSSVSIGAQRMLRPDHFSQIAAALATVALPQGRASTASPLLLQNFTPL